ncbi:hypothetical protein BGE01nite_31660 [Brevifollis gellanilyticus]|uniref:Uncharacterized protein n=1 Tax=Brevifollis gellanilyticus TaxID=748831 RepID=A0A512MAV8_9BACT|nr:hypothetical protein BGE01nite_31660 [Brevifollis gellanilyticus]
MELGPLMGMPKTDVEDASGRILTGYIHGEHALTLSLSRALLRRIAELEAKVSQLQQEK